VRPGQVVSFQLPNWWEALVLHLAVIRIGAVSNPLMPIL
jgi:cyclohexanecarboxylate-CoA ligase